MSLSAFAAKNMKAHSTTQSKQEVSSIIPVLTRYVDKRKLERDAGAGCSKKGNTESESKCSTESKDIIKKESDKDGEGEGEGEGEGKGEGEGPVST